MRKIAIIGVGQTKFGEEWTKSLRDLAIEAGIKAIEDAKIEGKEIEALYIGNMSGIFTSQEHLAALAADMAGLNPIPSIRCEAACASGSVAFRNAYLSILSGQHDIVMAAGAEKMTDIVDAGALNALMSAGDQEWEGFVGLTFAGLYALIARRHMHEFGTTQEQLALVSVNNHKNALKNEYAQFRQEITVEDVLSSPIISDPLHLLDCSPITDGAAAIILASEEAIKRLKIENPIWVLGVGQASAPLALHDRKSLTRFDSTIIAARKAYSQAKISAKDIEYAEVHDCFSINEILAIEDLGFCEKGEGGKFVEKNGINEVVKVNSTGGLKAIGHPVGATGIRQLCDLTRILREKGKYGLAQNVGGSGSTCVVTILGSKDSIKG
ncbi:MAG: thiolase domain-containing protein [Candidatus Aenigmatarchaeota archaeon]|nr:thiolase domain-containing protein [Candidatus Aenigmarchaeota archaeon]